jgi:hypothetical protein
MNGGFGSGGVLILLALPLLALAAGVAVGTGIVWWLF